MSKQDNITIVPKNLRSKFAPKLDQDIILSLDQSQQVFVETDRSATVNLAQVYDDERQRSTLFRPTFKLQFVFENRYYGVSQYDAFENQFYYINETDAIANCKADWTGYPQYHEFTFIRDDYNVSGYTVDSGTTRAHVLFETQSASSYNWSIYLSYPHKNIDLPLEYYAKVGAQYQRQNQWKSSEGIPFIIENRDFNGRNVISFICPMNHGLEVGEAVKLSFKVNNNDLFLVDSLGDETFGSETYIFNIDDIGYGNVFQNGKTGTFKRVIDIENEKDTTSKYYIREHKILTVDSDTILNKSGFELNAFNTYKKILYGPFTPNGVQRVAEKEGNQSYNITFKNEVDINGLLDNQMRPITKLYLTVINKGYFGWFHNPTLNGNQTNALKFGFDFNIKDETNPWWGAPNTISNETNIGINSYQKTQGALTFNFYYNKSLNTGDTLYGDFCEWNDHDQNERVISNLSHKIRFNPGNFRMEFPQSTNNPNGYYYKAHYPITIKEFSTYIETATIEEIDAAPDYSYFSESEKNFRWRDIYTYGFRDEQNVGVDYPFLNGRHYPYRDLIFRLRPEGSYDTVSYLIQAQLITRPKTDECSKP